MRRQLVLALLVTSGCLLKRGPALDTSVHYDRFRGQIAFSATPFGYSADEDRRAPLQLLTAADLTRPIHVKAFLPRPFGRAGFETCPYAEVPEHGSYRVANFMTVALDGETTTLYVEELIEPYLDDHVEVESRLFDPEPTQYPTYWSYGAYQFAVHLLPRLKPGVNRLVVTSGIRCMSDPSRSVQLSSTLELNVDEAVLAKVRETIGPSLAVPRLTNLRGLIPTLTSQIADLFPGYTPLLVEPLDHNWIVEKNGFDIPTYQHFEAFVIARHEASGRCFGKRVIVHSDFVADGFGAPEPYKFSIWQPFPCENLDKRVDYVSDEDRRRAR